MKRALVLLAVAGLVLSALGYQFTRNISNLAASVASPRITETLDESRRIILKGNTHPLARPQYDRGPAPADLPMNRMLLLLKRSPEQEASLRQLLDQQQDRNTSSYHKWLTPDEFGRRFGPADQDIEVTKSWLQQHGFRVEKVSRGRSVIEFSGTAAQVEETFATSIHQYFVNGKNHWSNASDPQIPAALAPVVAGVASLHNFERQPRLRKSAERFALQYRPGGQPEITGPDGSHFLAPGDFGVIYNVNPLYKASPRIDGSGIVIGVVGRTNISLNDIFSFRSIFSLFTGQTQVVLNGPDPGDLGGGEEFEADLDNSWTAAVAPGATIDFVVSGTTNTSDGVILSELYIIDNNLADVMTESFGTCEAALAGGMTEAELVAEQAAAEGITFVASAGDSGAAGCDDPNSAQEQSGLSVSVPASTPFAVGVGGTQFNEGNNTSKYWSSNTQSLQSALSYIPEDVWNESCSTNCPRGVPPNLAATGGGISLYPQPAWQSGVRGIPSDARRHVPDVSLSAGGHDPYLICAQDSCSQNFLYAVGGTSASAPSFAGIMALVDQKMGGRQGLANYVLYQIAHAQNYSSCNGSSGTVASSCVFNDVTAGNNGVPGESGYPASSQYPSGVGYDSATGLGSVNVANLLKSWSLTNFNSTTTTLLPSSISGTHGQAQTVTISVTSPNGTPAGTVSLVTDIPTPNVNGFQTVDLCHSTNGCTLDGTGNLTTSTLSLPGGASLASGTYNLHAHYAGNASFKASDSAPIPVTISAEASTVKLTVGGGFNSATGAPTPLPSSIPYGTFVYLRADVSGQTNPGLPPTQVGATGSVNFLDNGSYFGVTYPLNTEASAAGANGFYGFTPGAHSVTANYLGDHSFLASTSSPPALFTVTQAASSIALSYQGESHGAGITADVRTGSGGNSPSGSVSLLIDGNPFGTPVFVTELPAITNSVLPILLGAPPVITGAHSTANWDDSQLPNGQHTLQASYAGDANYTSSSASLAINLQPDFVLSTDNNVIGIASPGGSGGLNVIINALDGFNGTVNFTCSGLPAESTCNFSPTTLKGGGQVSLTVTTKAPTSSALRNLPGPRLWAASASIGIVGVLFLQGVPGKRRWRRLLTFLAGSLIVIGLGCGGGSSSSGPPPQRDPGTAAGVSQVVVHATSGNIAHTTSFQLVVN